MRSSTLMAALTGLALLAGGCGSGQGSGSGSDQGSRSAAHASSHPSTSKPGPPSPSTLSTPSKVLVVVEENHSLAQMRAGMPFLATESEKYGYATSWTAITHPSEPNYLAIAGGSTFGITDDDPPQAHDAAVGSATSVFDQALAAGRTARTYAESMPAPCARDDSDGDAYAVKHNPWAYFPASREACLRHDVPLTDFADDAASDALPEVGFLIPDLTHDAHDGTLTEADTWLKEQLGPVLSSDDFTTGKLVVVVTADEDDRQSGNTVLTSVLTPALSGKVVDTALTHYSLTRYIADVLGVTPLGHGRDAPDMKAAFGL